MNEIITQGTEIKQRIISELNNSKKSIYLAMAWFTDRDIAAAIIEAKNRYVNVEIILSSNVQNDTVKQMLVDAGAKVHAFATGDERGIMHHKFCLIDSNITINGSYNYSYNASNNNVENIHVSDDYVIYKQLLSEFERLKYNIDHNIAVSTVNKLQDNNQKLPKVSLVESFHQQLQNLINSSTQIDIEDYKKRGYEKSKENSGNIEIFKSEYNNISEQIRIYAADDSLSSIKDILSSNINTAFEAKKNELTVSKNMSLEAMNNGNNLEKKHLTDKITEIKEVKKIYESGNPNTDEKGVLQINKEIEKNKLERKAIEQTLVVKKFGTVGTIACIIFLVICVFYLSIFFASALYKVFFEGNIYQAALENGINPGLPQIVDANAIIKIFKNEGALFGIISALIFLFPLALTNLKILGSKNKLTNTLSFLAGLFVFDILVSGMVALNTDKIESLLQGQEPSMAFWEVIKEGEFYLIFVFGMLPLFITHFLIDYVANAYSESSADLVDGEKSRKLQILDQEIIELNFSKDFLTSQIVEKEELIKENNEKILKLEKDINDFKNETESTYANLHNQIANVFNDFNSKILSGKIFKDEILTGVISAYKAGFIDYLPEYYADNEVSNRVREIEQIIIKN
jgi:hypothetical protein